MSFLTVVEKGKVCNFTLSLLDYPGFAFAFFDVVRNSTQTIILADQTFTTISDYGSNLQFGYFDTASGSFVAGEQYTVILKEIEGLSPSTFYTLGVSVVGSMTVDMRTIIDCLTYLKNDVENVVFPRLKRVLAATGENLLLDLFTYDPAGNIESVRVRQFDSKANCEAATPGIEDAVLPEVGEVVTLQVTQENERPRCVRTMHRSVPVTDPADGGVTDNQAAIQVYALGNEGGWPVA